MKKTIAIILVLVFVFACCACSAESPAEAPKSSVPAETPAEQSSEPVQEEPTVDPKSPTAQVSLIFDNIDRLKSDDGVTKYYYTVTDLDHNGRLELFSALTQGTDNVTTGRIFEVNENYDGFIEADLGLSQRSSLPEVVTNKTDCYNDNETYYYIYSDTSSINSGEHYISKIALSLKDEKLTLKELAYQNVVLQNGLTVYIINDSDGRDIDIDQYDQIDELNFPNAKKSEVNFDWFDLASATSAERLAESYSVFSGDKLPSPATPTPAPTAAPVQTPQIVDNNVVITKHPTTENTTEGGNATFIARATGYYSISWQLIDPNGNIYDINSSPFPAMYVSGSNQPQLTLSNVPIGINNWSVRALFYGANTAYTNQAKIYVASKPIVEKYVTANPASGTYFDSLYNNVCLYSSDGSRIHYECIKGGDSGPYDSGEIGSGGWINIEGIEGACVDVEIYANVVGSDRVSYFYYTVDRTPAPVPVPTPDPDPPIPGPITGTMRGTVTQYQSMNYIEVTLQNGDTVGLMKDIFSGGQIAEGNMCTVYFFNYPSSENITSVIMD